MVSVITSDTVFEDALRTSAADSVVVIQYRDSLQSVEHVSGAGQVSMLCWGIRAIKGVCFTSQTLHFMKRHHFQHTVFLLYSIISSEYHFW